MKQKTMKIIYWIITGLFVAFMLFSGISEVMRTESSNQVLTQLGYPVYLNLIIGTAKIIGALVLIIPQFKILKEWAYAGFTIDFIGASASYLFTSKELIGIISPIVFLGIMFISYYLWKKTYSKT